MSLSSQVFCSHTDNKYYKLNDLLRFTTNVHVLSSRHSWGISYQSSLLLNWNLTQLNIMMKEVWTTDFENPPRFPQKRGKTSRCVLIELDCLAVFQIKHHIYPVLPLWCVCETSLHVLRNSINLILISGQECSQLFLQSFYYLKRTLLQVCIEFPMLWCYIGLLI